MAVIRRRWFQYPWDFRESILFTAVVVTVGFFIQYAAAGSGVALPRLPVNAIALSLFAVLVLSIGHLFRNAPMVKWFGGIPLGLCLIFAIAVLSLIGGIVPQEPVAEVTLPVRLGMHRIFSSWPFALTVICFLANLGIGLSWKIVPFKTQNIQFILFHAGFWIALSCGIFGSSDLQRLILPVEEGKASNIAYTMENETPRQLPFSIFLHDFALEEYAPNLLLYDPHTNTQTNIEVHKGSSSSWKGCDVLVLDYIPYALPDKEGKLLPADQKTGVPFAKVRISADGKSDEMWIGLTNPSQKPEPVQLSKLYVLLWPGTPKSFRSAVTVQDDQGREVMANLEVNKPVNFMGWKLYQMGYDEKAGRLSSLSLIEVIRDPWLPVVYLGFFMIMAGNVLFFWNGIKRSKDA